MYKTHSCIRCTPNSGLWNSGEKKNILMYNTDILGFVATKISICLTFYCFVLTNNKDFYNLYLGQMDWHVQVEMQLACDENKLTLEKTKL